MCIMWTMCIMYYVYYVYYVECVDNGINLIFIACGCSKHVHAGCMLLSYDLMCFRGYIGS